MKLYNSRNVLRLMVIINRYVYKDTRNINVGCFFASGGNAFFFMKSDGS